MAQVSYRCQARHRLSGNILVWVEALHPSHQFFSHASTFSWVEPVLSKEDAVSCSRTQHRCLGEIPTCNPAIKSLALYQPS